MSDFKVVVLGDGGREHAICWKLSKSPAVSRIFAIPGNGGTQREKKVTNIQIDLHNFTGIFNHCTEFKIDLVVVGPEEPLSGGIVNYLSQNGFTCFGPIGEAARIEANKSWSKVFMEKYDIPTARWKSFIDAAPAKDFILNTPYSATVIKASGLAGGKGVIIATNKMEACNIVDDIMITRKFGDAGKIIVIEEYLEGEEVSVLAFSDGKTISVMPPVQDHKRLLNFDEGPNTGGMGSFCPYELTEAELEFIRDDILQKAIDGLRNENCLFVGVLYAGLMITRNGIKVLEFNCRFGDPETQVILPLLQTDLMDIFRACCSGTLNQCNVSWKPNFSCVSVVMASERYPNNPLIGRPISGLISWNNIPDFYIFHAGTAVKYNNRNEKITLTNGGRVLNVTAMDRSLLTATSLATHTCSQIKFDGCQYRTDIAHKGIIRNIMRYGSGSYKDAGVDISSASRLIQHIKPLIESTFKTNVLTSIGSFGAVVDVKSEEYSRPLLVSGCDGVGTKLKIALFCDKHDTIGQDLVAMCVNDILAHGAKPLFFLDYFACGKLQADTAEQVIIGITNGCKIADCSLIGGETAEMPGFYSYGKYDLAGFTVGVVDQDKLLPSKDIAVDDIIIYLPSSGLHSNGFSLVRKIMENFELSYFDEAPFSRDRKSFGEEFLIPTKIYVREVLPLFESAKIKAFAHITGGGLFENVVRVIPEHLRVYLDALRWNIPPIFAWIAAKGSINEHEMLGTFNCGVGAIVVVSPQNASEVCQALNSNVIGVIESRQPGESQIHVMNFCKNISKVMTFLLPSILSYNPFKKRVAVLISGNGSNLEALIESSKTERSRVHIVLAISSKETANGLNIARNHLIPHIVIKRDRSIAPEINDQIIQEAMKEHDIDIICLAGYMHILSHWFVSKWRGKILNVHPSLLPSFKGLHAQKQALQAGVKVTGCTVHFVEPEVDAGCIIEQAAVPVHWDDTEASLTERIKEQEHKIFPKALKHVATGKVTLNLDTGKIDWKK